MAAPPPRPMPETPPARRIPWWLLAVLGAGVAIAVYQWTGRGDEQQKIPLSEVARRVKAGEVKQIQVSGESLKVTLQDGTEQRSNREP